MSETTPATVLREARELLEASHWGQGKYVQEDRSGKKFYCVVGAIRWASGEYEDPDLLFRYGHTPAQSVAAVDFLCSAYALKAEDANITVWQWNDEPTRTKDEVIDLLRQAEELALVAQRSTSSPPA